MAGPSSDPRSVVSAAVACGVVLGVQAVGSFATRDTLFLSTIDAAARPAMVAAAGGLAILLAIVNFRIARRTATATLVPALFVLAAVLQLLNWILLSRFPAGAAQAFFLLTNGLGPLLGSSFWVLVTERVDPRTANQYFGRIGGAYALGGLLASSSPRNCPSRLASARCCRCCLRSTCSA